MIHVLSVGFMPTNCYIVASQESRDCAIIDPGGDADKILAFIRGQLLDVKYILLTHPHFDHAGAVAELVEATGALVGMHPDGIPMLDMGGGSARLGLNIRSAPRPNILLTDGQNLEVGTLRLRVLHIPGHAPGHVAFYEPQHRAVFCGDILLAGDIGQTNILGGNYHQLMDHICRKLMTLGDETSVYPGHGPATTIGQERERNPWLCQPAEAILPPPSLVPLRASRSSKRPLFFVHPIDGRVMCYADLARHLGIDRSCFGLQSPGLEGDCEPHTQVETMACHYIDLIRTVQPTGPYFLSGWSTGGLVAFEMAQHLQSTGQEVALLVLMDTHAPTGVRQAEPDGVALLSQFALGLGLPLERIVPRSDYLIQLEAQDQLAFVLEQAKQASVLPANVELAQVGRMFDVFKCNLQAVQNYAPRPCPAPIVLFRAEEQPAGLDEDLGWSSLASGGLTVHTIPGNHASLICVPHVKTLVEQLKRHLRAAEVQRKR
jgi:thioesterase domain-containing protein/glyoxylase-like metal-dependent hydrolase (beta-lactamase superfamily II)